MEVIEVFFKLIILRHGCAIRVLTDQGRQLIGKIFKKLCNLFNIQREETSAYHYKTSVKIEKFIKFLTDSRAIIMKKYQTNWDELLDHVLFTYRKGLNRSLKDNPFIPHLRPRSNTSVLLIIIIIININLFFRELTLIV